MEKRAFDGAVVSVVKDGEILFEAGYGMADAVDRRPFCRTPSFLLRSVVVLSITALSSWVGVTLRRRRPALAIDLISGIAALIALCAIFIGFDVVRLGGV